MYLCEFTKDRVHPRRGQRKILEKFTALMGGDGALQVFPPLRRYMLLAQFAEGLDQQTT